MRFGEPKAGEDREGEPDRPEEREILSLLGPSDGGFAGVGRSKQQAMRPRFRQESVGFMWSSW